MPQPCSTCRVISPGAGFRMTVCGSRLTASGPWLDPGSDIAGDILWNQEAGFYQLFVRPVYGDRRVAMSTTADFTQFTRPVTIHTARCPGPRGDGAVRHAAATV